jgi:hypothetical protein
MRKHDYGVETDLPAEFQMLLSQHCKEQIKNKYMLYMGIRLSIMENEICYNQVFNINPKVL